MLGAERAAQMLGAERAAQMLGAERASIEERIDLKEWLLVPAVGRSGRMPFPHNPITHSLVMGTFQPPEAGDTIPLETGKQAVWTSVRGPDEGPLQHAMLLGGWAYAKINAAEPRRAILRAKGHSIAYVNGVPRVTNVYRYDYVMIPLLIEKGDNHFLFRCTRFGTLEAWLEPVTHDLMINMEDATLPEAVRGETHSLDAGIVFINTTTRAVDIASAQGPVNEEADDRVRLPSCWMPPFSIAKVPVKLPSRKAEGEKLLWTITGDRIQPASVEVAVVEPGAFRKVTFPSKVEGSVQYFGFRPPRQPNDGGPFALLLHLHGASDEASAYRNLYLAKTWCAMASATNRRPYGFGWESLGRTDAMEVLDQALAIVNVDPSRVYLGGHSMGGHGVWQIAGHFPDRFAAIGPGAGWQDIWTYAGAPPASANPTPVQKILDTCANPSRTALLAGNYLQQGVLIIHGDADGVVPIDEAYRMSEILEKAGHDDWTFVIEPGGGHVYDSTPEQGHSCFDLLELFEFFQRHARPIAPQRVDFTTVTPAISDTCHWVRVVQQVRQLEPSRVKLQLDPGRRWLHGSLKNVRRFSVDPSSLVGPGTITVQLDDEKEKDVGWAAGALHFLLTEEGWRQTLPPDLSMKGPHRSGPFKEVFFNNNPALVVGTCGTEEENAWALAKARFDNETLWYRGNASLEIVTDRSFDPAKDPDRNVVLYGNRETNLAWKSLVGQSPVDVEKDRAKVGDRTYTGSDLACLAIRPRLGSDRACVGIVGGSGLAGMRATNELGFFNAGVHYPDFVIFSADVWKESEQAVLATGLFGNDWNLDEDQSTRVDSRLENQ